MSTIQTEPRRDWFRRHPILSIILAVFLVLFLLAVMSGGGEVEPDEIGASAMCEDFVADALRSPSTAEFASYLDQTVNEVGDGRFAVSSYVDAENGFGAMIRNEYTCTVESVDGETWRLRALTLDGEKLK